MLKPLYDKLHKQLAARKILHADETSLEVLKLQNRDVPLNAYMRICRTSRFEENPIVLYDYQEGRSGSYAKDYSTAAGQAFLMIAKLFESERISPDKPSEISEYSLEKIAEIRKNISTKILDEFFDFCDKHQGVSLSKSLTGTAITYALNQKETLMTFLDDPKLELSNNAAERAVKPFVIDRKNWLFYNTAGGADSSAIIYSIIETVKENSVKPFEYLEFLFENIRVGNDAAELVPWNEKVPENIKMKGE